MERAAQSYQASPTCDASVKQAVEDLFKAQDANNGFIHLFDRSHVSHALVQGAIEAALNNLLRMNFCNPFIYLFFRKR